MDKSQEPDVKIFVKPHISGMEFLLDFLNRGENAALIIGDDAPGKAAAAAEARAIQECMNESDIDELPF